MKISRILGVAAIVATANATFADTLSALGTVGAYLGTSLVDFDFWDGVILGVQYDSTNTAHSCYTSWLDMRTNIEDVEPWLVNLAASGGSANSAIVAFTDTWYYQPGTYVKLVKRGTEIANLFFYMYGKCYIEDLLIAFGLAINSFSGAGNTAITLFITFLSYLDYTDSTTDLAVMETYANNGDATEFGKMVGQYITTIFNFSVPSAEYGDY